MARPATAAAPSQASPHKRTRSNPFKILVPGQKAETHGVGVSLQSKESPKKYLTRSRTDTNLGTVSVNQPLTEVQNEQRRPKRDRQPTSSIGLSLHKRTRSAVSLKSLTGGNKSKENGEEKESPLKSLSKKSKSSTNLAALFSRPKSRGRKDESVEDDHDKENANPPPAQIDYSPPPIWAQFATRSDENANAVKVLLNDVIESPRKDRSSAKGTPQNSPYTKFPMKPATRLQLETSTENAIGSRRGSRVQAAVAAFDGKSREALQQQTPTSPSKRQTIFDAQAVETAFEALLESRNIPAEVRDRMRTMELSLKAEFVEKNQHVGRPTQGNEKESYLFANSTKSGRVEKEGPMDSQMAGAESIMSSNKVRPRSFTLTPNKADGSPTKKVKHGRSGSRSRPLSIDLPRSRSSTSLASQYTAASPGRGRAQKQTPPEHFIDYFRTSVKPQDVEVGRLQKLRQLLRNETVAWVETFVVEGGFEEVVGLLHRIIQIEWREEHEDALLHHTLNCLKALCTTSSGLSCLGRVQAKLFPALLKLLFSSGEEKRGPSEFTTRELIIFLLFSYLQSCPDGNPGTRANALLAYLRDLEPSESEQPPAFMLGMHRPRPFKQWVSEISGVTKEVFWIFLHHVNVIPYPQLDGFADSYLAMHFPPPRPPVAAAPYVGSIEWDATNYLATHLDLVNGLIASLPTARGRNDLRTQLRDSGLEKVMGVSLRTCKEKFYGAVHSALSTWVGAADADGWETRFVREGPTREEKLKSSPGKKRRGDQGDEKPPVLGEIKVNEGPKLGFGLGLQVMNPDEGEEARFLL